MTCISEVLGGLNGERTPFNTRRSDVWALGIILMNLVCGCLPWSRASIEDRDFLTFVFRDPDYFYNNFPISVEVNDIFKSIFTIRAEARATIPEIRRSILALRTFYDHSEFSSSPSISDEIDEIDDLDADYMGLSLTDQAHEALRALRSVDFAEIEAQIAARIRMAQLYASVGEQLPNDIMATQDFTARFPAPPATMWNLNMPANPTLHLANPGDDFYDSDSDLSDSVIEEYLQGLSDDDDLDNTDSDSEGPITPEQVPIDNTRAATAIEDIQHIEDIDLGTSTTGTGTEMHISPITRKTNRPEAFVIGTEVSAIDKLATNKLSHMKAVGADQAQFSDTTATIWTPGWVS